MTPCASRRQKAGGIAQSLTLPTNIVNRLRTQPIFIVWLVAGVFAVVATSSAPAVLALAATLGWFTGRRSANGHANASAWAAEATELTRERDRAVAANVAKGRYLANVSHEIRAPLNAIYGYAQLLERGGKVDAADAARVIRRSAEHLTNLAEGLLDIASVEQGVVRVEHGVVRPGAVVEQIVEMFRPLAARKGLVLRADLPSHMPDLVRMDERRVRQVLINLVSNAIKFTPRGEVVVALRWPGKSSSGELAVFEVRDTGPGISESAQNAIFAPYARLDENVPQTDPGAGLGLAITRAIVTMLGGELSVDATPGEGSRFSVRLMLPRVAGLAAPDDRQVRATGYAGDRRSILLVDDDPDHLALLRSVLGGLGFDVAESRDGDTALAIAGQGQFDAVVMDVVMPCSDGNGLTGWEAAAHLRAVHGDRLKIIMLSGNVGQRHGPAGRGPDHDRFLAKPVDLAALTETLGEVLRLQWTFPAAETPVAGVARAAPTVSPRIRHHAERLKSLVRIGHVRALEGEIRQLEQAEPAAAALAARLYDCLDRFDLAALGQTLEEV